MKKRKSKNYKRNQARATRFVKKYRKLFTPKQKQGSKTK
jgi:hypothetical protein